MIVFHPLAMEYRRMSDDGIERMSEDMKENGFDPTWPIIKYREQILDGCNRQIAADKAGVKPVYEEFKGTEEQAREFVKRANEDRRHLSAGELEQKRRERIDRIAAARQSGKSTRAIAETEGISVSTVHGDLKKSGVRPRTPEPEEAEKPLQFVDPKNPICSRCKRIGKVKDCPNCADMEAEVAANKPKIVTGKDGKKYPAEKPATKTKPTKSGAAKFDDRPIKEIIGKLARMLNERANALGLQKSKGWADVREKMEHLLAAWDRWQLEKK